LALAFEGAGDGGDEVLDAGDVHLLQRFAAEGLDGERHGLQRLFAGLLRRNHDFVELRGLTRLREGRTGLQRDCHRRRDGDVPVPGHLPPPFVVRRR
jgi:hypothetical protein